MVVSHVFGIVAPAATDRVAIAIIGDYGYGADALPVANLVKRWEPDFIMTLGDNNYGDYSYTGYDQNVGQFYHEFISPYGGAYGVGALSNRFFPCLGDHDYLEAYQAFFTLPGNERYYKYRYGPVEIFALNSGPWPGQIDPDGNTASSVQAEWLRGALSNSTAPWKLVYFHHPAYSSGCLHGSYPHMRWPFEAWGASAVFSGDDHVYERLRVGGIPYFVNGLGGAPLYGFCNVLPESQAHYDGDHGALRVFATETNIFFEFVTPLLVSVDRFSIPARPAGYPFLQSYPADRIVRPYSTVTFGAGASGASPLRLQWYFNDAAIPGATNTVLGLTNVQLSDQGRYALLVSNSLGVVLSDPASLSFILDPRITALQRQPVSHTVPIGAQVTFRVQAEGAGPLRYQWQMNNQDLADETNMTLVLSNVQLSHTGDFRVRVSDDFGSVLGDPAPLVVLIPPTVILSPVTQSIVRRGDVTFSTVAAGSLPINYAWRLGGIVLTNALLNSYTSFFTIRNVQSSNAGSYRVALTNFSSPSLVAFSTNAILTVLPDADGDLLPDDWEAAFNFATNNAADATGDADGDGASNRQEYVAGTNPRDPASHLRLSLWAPGPGTAARLSFEARSNLTYVVERRNSLHTGSWDRLTEVVATQTNRRVELIDPTTPQPPQSRFYRIATPRLP